MTNLPLELYGGEAAALPAIRQLKRVRRDNEILKLYRQGLDRAAIGRRFGISERAVNVITLRGWVFAVEDYEVFMPASFCELAQRIGLENAEKLCDALNGQIVQFPDADELRAYAKETMEHKQEG